MRVGGLSVSENAAASKESATYIRSSASEFIFGISLGRPSSFVAVALHRDRAWLGLGPGSELGSGLGLG